jgi:hypothetical protein
LPDFVATEATTMEGCPRLSMVDGVAVRVSV